MEGGHSPVQEMAPGMEESGISPDVTHMDGSPDQHHHMMNEEE